MSATGKAAGFTLIELLVALAILAVAVSLAPISFDRIAPARQLDAQAEQFATELRDLRALALVTGLPREVRRQRDGIWIEDAKKDLPDGFVIKAGAAPGTLVFFPDGSTTGGDFTLTGVKGERRITVTMATGLVKVTAP